ncbi:MAG: hypothetical protein E7Z87_01075 [Cyanobacteria bacterium SIG26]|nr:hypothetical protein [Cyanobacteria bacterium SIG26]
MIITAIKPFAIHSFRQQNSNPNFQYNLVTPISDTVSFGAKITAPKYTIDNVLDIFNGKCTDIPKHLKTLVSPRTNKIMGFTLKTSNKTELKVFKKVSAEYGDKLTYLSFEETLPNNQKKFIAYDLDSKEFIKTSPLGKPVVEDGILYNLDSEQLEKMGINNRLNNYLKDIYAKSKRKTAQDATILTEKKAATKKTIKIDDIKVEDIEDENLNKILDKENISEK